MAILILLISFAFASTPQPGCLSILNKHISHSRISVGLLDALETHPPFIGVWLHFDHLVDGEVFAQNSNLNFMRSLSDGQRSYILVRGELKKLVELLSEETEFVYASYEFGFGEQPHQF